MKRIAPCCLVYITIQSAAQVKLPKWAFGGGLRFNYPGLTGGYSGDRYSDNYTLNVDYTEIGLGNHAPGIAFTFAGSRGPASPSKPGSQVLKCGYSQHVEIEKSRTIQQRAMAIIN
ncbi:MAG: hypothetical protein MI866_16180 [Bacteroidales bacterium]|nr:hypothetical protein [Bacteroidales bacterium]